MEYKSCFLLICLLYACSVVNGCGQLPTGQERSINFNVTDFKLPPVMVYSADADAKKNFPKISTNKGEAVAFVKDLIMRSVHDVLYQQGRSAFLSDSVISQILQQLEIQVNYEPLNCIKVLAPMGMGAAAMDMINCVISGDIVTNICTHAMAAMCEGNMLAGNSKLIPSQYLSFSGSLKTTNSIMATWSNQMWQSVLNRVLRTITSGANGSYFYGASIKII